MKKENAAVEAALSAGIVESFKIDIAEVQNDMERQGVAYSISKAREEGHISEKQEKELLAMLGVEPPKDAETFNAADAKAWEETLRGKYEELRSAALKIKALKDELKDARKVYSQIQDEINAEAGQGSKDFKARERTLFDGVEE